jgi:dephospho-CoA kinase
VTNTLFRVVLTGGIASGKTAVANEFTQLGIVVIDTDQLSRDVVAPGTPGLSQISKEFGPSVIGEDGTLDRRKLRQLVFADTEKRRRLEAIVHPAVREELRRQSLLATSAYQIHAIPLFIEGGGKGDYDRVLVVDCPESLQIQRVMQRDQVDEMQARQVLAAQATRQQRLAIADDVISNNSDIESLRAQVLSLHDRYLALAEAKAR